MPSTRRDSSTQNHSTPTPTSVSTLEAALWRLIPHIMLPIYGIFYEPVTDNVTVKRKPKKSKKGKRGKRAHGQRVADDESRTEMLDRDVVVSGGKNVEEMRNVVGTLADVDGEGGVNEANTRDLDNDIAVFSPIHKPDDGSLSSPKTPNVMPDDSTIPFFKSLPQDPMNVRPNDSFLPSPKTLSQFPKVMPDDSSIPTPSQDPNFTPPVVDAGYPVQTKQKPKKKKNKKPESNFVIGSSVWAMQKECSSSTMVDISEVDVKVPGYQWVTFSSLFTESMVAETPLTFLEELGYFVVAYRVQYPSENNSVRFCFNMLPIHSLLLRATRRAQPITTTYLNKMAMRLMKTRNERVAGLRFGSAGFAMDGAITVEKATSESVDEVLGGMV